MKSLKFWLIVSVIFTAGCDRYSTRPDAALVRVAVIADADELKLSVGCPYRIFSLDTNEELGCGRRLRNVKIVPSARGMEIGVDNFNLRGIRVQPERSRPNPSQL